MALSANKIPSGPILTNRTSLYRSHAEHNFSVSTRINRVQPSRHKLEHEHLNNGFILKKRSTLFNDRWFINRKPVSLISKESSFSCKSTGANNTEEKECVTTYDDVSDIPR